MEIRCLPAFVGQVVNLRRIGNPLAGSGCTAATFEDAPAPFANFRYAEYLVNSAAGWLPAW